MNSQPHFAVISEMQEAPKVVSSFDFFKVQNLFKKIGKMEKIFLTGEGSSRIFPAKNAIARSIELKLPHFFHTECSYQAGELPLQDWTVFGASNSGRTKELILLFEKLRNQKISTVGITANQDTPLEKLSSYPYLLSCGVEKAVAATKCVVEQALFYEELVHFLHGKSIQSHLDTLSQLAKEVLESEVPKEMVQAGIKASKIYWCGRNNGVAEELVIKTMELTGKPAMYLEGTLVLHGIEETMKSDEMVLVMDPFEPEEDRFVKNLQKGVGVALAAISPRKTSFQTYQIPSFPKMSSFLQLLAGWNFLVQLGLSLGRNLDKPLRARKIGNEI